MWLDDDGSVYNNKIFDIYYLERDKIIKENLDKKILDSIDIDVIVSYLRNKKLKKIDKK